MRTISERASNFFRDLTDGCFFLSPAWNHGLLLLEFLDLGLEVGSLVHLDATHREHLRWPALVGEHTLDDGLDVLDVFLLEEVQRDHALDDPADGRA